jgi:hypothetical protein
MGRHLKRSNHQMPTGDTDFIGFTSIIQYGGCLIETSRDHPPPLARSFHEYLLARAKKYSPFGQAGAEK